MEKNCAGNTRTNIKGIDKWPFYQRFALIAVSAMSLWIVIVIPWLWGVLSIMEEITPWIMS